MEFTTKDRDNDKSTSNCARKEQGGWWYRSCSKANLNGVYGVDRNNRLYGPGITWTTWTKLPLKKVKLGILPSRRGAFYPYRGKDDKKSKDGKKDKRQMKKDNDKESKDGEKNKGQMKQDKDKKCKDKKKNGGEMKQENDKKSEDGKKNEGETKQDNNNKESPKDKKKKEGTINKFYNAFVKLAKKLGGLFSAGFGSFDK